MESTVKQRLMDFIKKEGISVREFERTCGLSNGYVSTLLSSISSDKYNKILSTFPKINPQWLLRGEGNMYVGESKVSNNSHISNSMIGNIHNTYEERYLSIIEKCQEQLSVCQTQLSDAMQTIKTLSDKI
ncbi:MAG: hypothetical protein LUC37_01845 [Prevotella sp.]|nr:hypothetical protein [Prevotella sp.]